MKNPIVQVGEDSSQISHKPDAVYTPVLQTNVGRKGLLVGYIIGFFTALLLLFVVMLPLGVTTLTLSKVNESEPVKIIRTQEVPSSSPTE